MKNTARRMIGLLGVALMATQLFGTVNTQSLRSESSSGAFEQAAPATAAQTEVEKLLSRSLPTQRLRAGTPTLWNRSPAEARSFSSKPMPRS
jgi:hypothetical protein